jgi:hypothetical protein
MRLIEVTRHAVLGKTADRRSIFLSRYIQGAFQGPPKQGKCSIQTLVTLAFDVLTSATGKQNAVVLRPYSLIQIQREIIMAKNTAVYGIYSTRTSVENAVDILREEGFRSIDISVLFSDNEETKKVAVKKNTKAPEGIATGAGSGAVIGGALGWLVGIGALAIPGVGPFIAAGPIIGLLSGLGLGSAVGGIAGGLIGLGMPEYEAKRYEGRVKDGGILLSIHCKDSKWTDRAKKILKETGAEDISSSGEASADSDKSDRPMHRTSSADENFDS